MFKPTEKVEVEFLRRDEFMKTIESNMDKNNLILYEKLKK